MNTKRTNKVLTMSVLCVAVLALAVGFAAFSNTLTVSTNASVTPDANTFKVVFSSDSGSLKTDAVAPVPSDLGESGTIDNTTNPTISNLQANFTNPGESVTYTFYVRNEGEFLAYLNSINLRGKNCVPGDGADYIMVNSACSSITTTVSIGDITTSATKTDITGETLNPGESKEVTVTISYDENGSRADGPFTVEFGDITMFYSTVTGQNEEVTKICQLTNDVNGNNEVDLGDEVACAGENFIVVPNYNVHGATDSDLTLLAQYNLNVGADVSEGTLGIQNAEATGMSYSGQTELRGKCNFTGQQFNEVSGAEGLLAFYKAGYGCNGSLPFAETNYWGTASQNQFIYNNKSLLYPYVENYKTYLKNKGIALRASLLSSVQYQEMMTLASEQSLYRNLNITEFWLGSATGGTAGVHVFTASTSVVAGSRPYYNGIYAGVRPVIIIKKNIVGV